MATPIASVASENLKGASPIRSVVGAIPLGIGDFLVDLLLGDITKPFTKGFVFEVIDVRQPRQALITKSLVINPKRYNLSEPFSVNLTPAEDDSVVAEENGIIIREIVLEGTTGIKKRKEEALGRGGSLGTEASGVDHFRSLRKMFRDYSTMKKDLEMSPFIQMHFHDVKQDDHFVVVPRSFETPRDAATNRVHFNYRITLAAIMELPPPSKPPKEFDFFGLGDAIKDIAEAVHDARAFLVEGINEIETIRHRIRHPNRMFESVAGSINSAHDLIDGIVGLIEAGEEFWAATEDLAEDVEEIMTNEIIRFPTFEELKASRNITRCRHALERIHNRREKFGEPLAQGPSRPFSGDRNLTNADLREGTGGATVGSRTRLALGSEREAGMDLGSFGGSKGVIIKASDTVDTLATRFNVPREAIISINDLLFPFITRSGAPGTLKPGDTILIPVRATAEAAGATPNDYYLTNEDILYGVDIALDPDLMVQGIFDIKIDEIHGSEDVELVRGVKNVVQGVGIITGTERQATDFISDLGIRRTVGVKGTLDLILTASVYLREAILSDPRIIGIDSSRVTLTGDVLEQEISPVLLNARDGVTLVVPYGNVSSG
jgi:hypothetical protein